MTALRPATPDDAEAIAAVWHAAWHDGHRGHVPAALETHRGLDHFRAGVPRRVPATTVAMVDGRVAGFVTVREDEVELVFVAAHARGRGVADALLRHAERVIARTHAEARLCVVEGNARARRFYERHGWRDAGGFDHAAEVPGGTLPVRSRRYVKTVRPPDGDGGEAIRP